ncbi:carboxypeptidase regulatory-like domain-containing protein [Mucilaginibacter sp. RS28]|uniref:Carboxypeptidase regulatory-like domain-containing protein n=1 Tax=Mucilaginibacter straminoryzae TaxID=2932774 RepID=A0A9X2BD28_9SPHI|nr:carboxypeptidase regulatory-like domain-containing protein [Mucilaginibacter straminoryzae]MCJ8211637.1 carboxypeptidase regulatory-like domain-containing protein [Mucilaginibacter straminoryzae]
MKKYLYPLLFLFCFSSAFAQRDSLPVTTVVQKAAVSNSEHPIEKVYLHFDKPYYAVGDTVWFKAYLTMDVHLPSAISKVVNVDVIGPRDSLIESFRIPVTNSTGSGRFVLNGTTYRQGNYRIRAYTNWMLNFKTSYFFDKTIAIGNALNKELSTQVSYYGNPDGKGAKPGAKIFYKDKAGNILAGKKVEWRIETNGDVITRGRGTTDAKGYLDVPVEDNKVKNFAGSTIITSVEVAEKKTASASFSLKNAFGAPDLQFFPEGGLLLSNIPMQVAFKAIRSSGLGIDVKGTIVDGTGKVVADFSSQHLGMGKVTFTPEANTTYKANAEFADGSKATVLLPRVVSNGVVLSVNNAQPDNLVIQIASTPAFYEKYKNRVFYLIARSGGTIAYAAQTALTSQTYSAVIPKSKFKSGVISLSLLTSSSDPVSERLVYINRDDNLNLTLSSDKPAYAARQHVAMKLTAKQGAVPSEGSFSVAVIDETKVPFKEDAETTILTNLLLTSDITGYVEQPNYYFNKPDAKKNADLDVLMMTQGFRQFDLYDVVWDKVPRATIAPEQGIDLGGTLRKLNGMPVFRGAVRLIIPDKNYSAETTTDADGNFVFKNVQFTDSSKVTVSARNNPDSRNMKITMNGDIFPSIAKSENVADEIPNIDSVLNTYILNSEKQYKFNQILKEVVIKSAPVIKKVSHNDYSALTGLPAMADRQLSGEMLKGCNNFFLCIQNSLPGVTFDNGNFYISRNYTQGDRTPMQIYVKGMQGDVNYLMSVNPAEVESVEVFFNDGVSGINRMTSTAGVISVNMKEAPKGTPMKLSDLKQLFPDQNIVTFTPKGYIKYKQFYSPKYTVVKSIAVSDLRTTIFWSPNIITDKTGTAVFDFYNSDGRGTYKAIVEGIDKDGNIGRGIYRFTVK